MKELETYHEFSSLEDLQKARNELSAARQNNADNKAKYKFSKAKQSVASKPWWINLKNTVLNFLTL